ncbi:hypothetical protein ACIRBX_35010 [Kitasatospora sp. NPDC096147]|uniref:hypothetical protein n=1 Tax=Kitasatospora sp. NPDC096147 TaxID=3364093 RepID=UPI00381E000B
MRKIDELLPGVGRADEAGLRAVPPEALARYATARQHVWWRRKACVEALAGRVPERRVPDLLARIRDRQESGEVRIALLALLGDRAELLPWLLRHDERTDGAHGLRPAVLQARGRLGDLTAARELATLAFSPWQHEEATGEAGLAGLVGRLGSERVLAELGVGRPEDRWFGFLTRYRADADVTDALADPDPSVAFRSHHLQSDPARLREYADRAPTEQAALLAAYAVHELTDDRAELRSRYAALGSPRVTVPGLDEEVRRAILHEYAPWCQSATDPRWRVEALCTPAPEPVDQEAQLARATAALAHAGLAPQPPVHCREDNRQGDGTYHVIRYGGAEDPVLVSTLGAFATGEDDDCPARPVLEAAGLRWIDAETGSVRVTDLYVYYFGSRAPLTVDTLLFFWQD